jgi:hypothetical protein
VRTGTGKEGRWKGHSTARVHYTCADFEIEVGLRSSFTPSDGSHVTGIFAQHFTSYLASWWLDVSHVSPDSEAEGSPVREAATSIGVHLHTRRNLQ